MTNLLSDGFFTSTGKVPGCPRKAIKPLMTLKILQCLLLKLFSYIIRNDPHVASHSCTTLSSVTDDISPQIAKAGYWSTTF